MDVMPQEACPTPRHPAREAGFTVVEVMMAVAVFAIMAGAMATTLIRALDTTRDNRHRSIAAHLASREMDIVRGTDFIDLPEGLVQSTVDVDGVPYTVGRESSWIADSGTTGACDGSGGTTLAFLRVTVDVTWPRMAGTQPVRSQTVLSPPVGSYDRYTGHIAVKVLDREGKPAGGHVVTLSGSVNKSQTTTSDGCAFFAFLDPGTYTASLGTLGYVDGQGDGTPSQTAGVTAGNTTSVQFEYDRAATLELTLQGSSGGVVPDGVPLTLGNSSLLPAGSKVVTGTGVARTVGNLFPYSNGYQVWAGDCHDADPEATLSGGSDPIYPGAQRQPPLPVAPGGTTTGTVTMASVDLLVTDRGGNPVPGKVVTASHDPDDGCPGGSTLSLGITDAAGRLRAAVPYGDWRFEVTGESPQGVWPETVLSPTDPPVPQVSVVIR